MASKCARRLLVVSYICGVDPSGGVHDSFCAAISHCEYDNINSNNTIVLDCLIEIKAPFNPSSATEQIVSSHA